MYKLILFEILVLLINSTKAQLHMDGSFESKFNRYHKGQIFKGNRTNIWKDTVWQNDRTHKQIILWSDKAIDNISYECTDLTKGSDKISARNIKLRFPVYVKGDSLARECKLHGERNTVYIADALSNVAVTAISPSDPLKIWVTIETPSEIPPGLYKGFIKIKGANNAIYKKFHIQLNVINRKLPDVADWKFHLDLWQFPFHILDIAYPSVKPFSPEHFALLKPYYTMLADAGQHSITTYIRDSWKSGHTMVRWTKQTDGTWKFNYTDFDNYVAQMMSWGINKQINCFTLANWGGKNIIRYFDEGSQSDKELTLTIGSTEFRNIWSEFLTDFKVHLLSKNWFEKVVLYMDEAEKHDIDKVIDVIRKNDPDWKIGYAGLFASPEAEKLLYEYSIWFTGHPVNDMSDKVFTFYTSCSHIAPNNFVTLVNSPAEMTWMAWYALSEKMDGYLRWGYDYGTQAGPLDVQDGNLTAGDFNMIHRNTDNSPLSSIRFELLRDGIQDFEKIKILNNKELNTLVEQFTEESGKKAFEYVSKGQSLLKRVSTESGR